MSLTTFHATPNSFYVKLWPPVDNTRTPSLMLGLTSCRRMSNGDVMPPHTRVRSHMTRLSQWVRQASAYPRSEPMVWELWVWYVDDSANRIFGTTVGRRRRQRRGRVFPERAICKATWPLKLKTYWQHLKWHETIIKVQDGIFCPRNNRSASRFS